MVTSLSHQLKTGFSVCRFYQLDIHWTCFCVVFLRPMLGDFFAPSTLKNSIFECWLEKVDYLAKWKIAFRGSKNLRSVSASGKRLSREIFSDFKSVFQCNPPRELQIDKKIKKFLGISAKSWHIFVIFLWDFLLNSSTLWTAARHRGGAVETRARSEIYVHKWI